VTTTAAEPAGARAAHSVTGSLVVTGANGFVGRALLAALEPTAARVTAVVRQPARLPASRILAGPLDAPWAMDAIEAADQVVHLAGALRPETSYWDANVQPAAVVARAVRRGVPRQIVYLSYVGASITARNEYLRSKAEAERILAATGRDLVVLRASHIVGTPEAPGPLAEALRARPDGSVLVPGDGTQQVAPVFVGDVVACIVAALAQGEAGPEPRTGPEPGTYDLTGPDTMTLNELVALVNRGQARIRHVPERLARLAALFLPSLPAALVDVMLRPCVGGSSRAAEGFGIALRSLRALWS
jgi:nucleoside-diphosphate-sugar epimerase